MQLKEGEDYEFNFRSHKEITRSAGGEIVGDMVIPISPRQEYILLAPPASYMWNRCANKHLQLVELQQVASGPALPSFFIVRSAV